MNEAVIEQLYHEGLSGKKIAEILDISERTIYRILERRSVKLRGHRDPPPDEVTCQAIIRAYIEGVPRQCIWYKYSICRSVFNRVIRADGEFDWLSTLRAQAIARAQGQCVRCGILSKNDLCEDCRQRLAAGERAGKNELCEAFLREYGFN